MNQQINLYQPIFRREKKVFSSAAMLQLGTLVLLGLMAIYGNAYRQIQPVSSQLSDLQAQRDRMRAQNEELLARRVKTKSELLEQQVARLAVELEERRAVAAALASGAFGDTSGFGDHLEALARQHVQGTWITALSIGKGGASVDIAGNALFPELVPVYIQRLSREPVFSGTSFNVLELARRADDATPVRFRLRTSEER